MIRLVSRLLRTPLFGNDDRAKATLATSMAFITLFATAVAFFQQDASINAGVAERTASEVGVTGIGRDMAALSTTTSAFGDFRRWYDHLEGANWASALSNAGGSGNLDPELLDAITTVETELSGWVKDRAELLQPPFFDEATYLTDFDSYIAQREVAPQTRAALTEQSQLALSNEYDARATAFVTILTLLAVSLFFLGLATTLNVRSRNLFAATGAGFTLAALLWTGLTLASPVNAVSGETIESIVTTRVELAQVAGGNGPISAANQAHLEAAVTAADEALATAPAWQPAREARAEAYAFYGDALFFAADGDNNRALQLLDQGIATYQQMIETEPDNYSTWWNLGWSQLLRGNYEASLIATDTAYELAPEQFALLLNRALAHVGIGDDDAARADVAEALQVAHSQALDSRASFFAQADDDIAELMALWPEDADVLQELLRTLREGEVALTALNQPAPAEADVELASNALVRVLLDEQGNFSPEHFDAEYEFESGDSFASDEANGVRLFVLGEGVDPGDMVSLRVWINGAFDPNSAMDVAWAPLEGNYMAFDIISPYGQAGFAMDPGQYELELYVNANTAAAMSWTVEAAEQ